MKTAIEILKDAKSKIAAPQNWGKGRRHFDRPQYTCCIAEAVEDSAYNNDNRRAALRAVYNAAGLDFAKDMITDWNDDDERTHAEVLAVLNLAIATLQL